MNAAHIINIVSDADTAASITAIFQPLRQAAETKGSRRGRRVRPESAGRKDLGAGLPAIRREGCCFFRSPLCVARLPPRPPARYTTSMEPVFEHLDDRAFARVLPASKQHPPERGTVVPSIATTPSRITKTRRKRPYRREESWSLRIRD
jgi:hypothetical protein